ncbi:Nephrocystin-1 [Terramyces sp. JEL0728]|nr:Nephrocystin-1 [Terramyces sp. JEL0728]
MTLVEAKYDYKAVTPQEMNIQVGNKYYLLDRENLDWWLVEDQQGNQGYVPATYVEITDKASPEPERTEHGEFQPHEQANENKKEQLTDSKEKIVEQVRKLQNTSRENLGSEIADKVLSLSKEKIVEQVQNANIRRDDSNVQPIEKNVKIQSSKNLYSEPEADESEDSSEESEESKESESEQESDATEESEQESDATEESDKTSKSKQSTKDQVQSVLQNLRKRKSQINKVHRGIKITEPEKIEGFESVPFGFKSSILAQNYKNGVGHAISYLTPQLNSCGLAFKDLHLGKKNTVRKRQVKCNVAFYVKEGRFIPSPQPLPVIGRHVRMSLFDKAHIVSNIHTVPAALTPEHEHNWRFAPKTFLKNTKENKCFVRTFDSDLKLCILFELCLVVKKPVENNNDELAEISCGWCILPLFTSDGKIVEPKKYELPIYTGSPFDKEIIIAESPAKESNFFTNLFAGSRSPCLVIRVSKLDKKSTNYLNDLPDVLVGAANSLHILSIYRQVLANTLLGKTHQPLGSKYEPVLAIIPKLLEEIDLLHHFVEFWRKRYASLPSREKKSYHRLKKQFTVAILTVWPLFYIDMPRYIPGNIDNMVARNDNWLKLQEQGAMVFLTKAANAYRPFSSEELEYSYYKVSKRKITVDISPFVVKIQLPTNDTTMVQVEELTSIAELIKIVEEKKFTKYESIKVYINTSDGKKIEPLLEETLSNYKQIDKIVFSQFNSVKASGNNESPISSRRGMEKLGLTIDKNAVVEKGLDSPSFRKIKMGVKGAMTLLKKASQIEDSPSSLGSNSSIGSFTPEAGTKSSPNASVTDAHKSVLLLGSAEKAQQLQMRRPRSASNLINSPSGDNLNPSSPKTTKFNEQELSNSNLNAITEEDTKKYNEKYNADTGKIWKIQCKVPVSMLLPDLPSAVVNSPISPSQTYAVFKLHAPDDSPLVIKMPGEMKMEQFCEKTCQRKNLDAEQYSFEYDDPPRPVEMDRALEHYAIPLKSPNLFLVKKAKVYSSISVSEDGEETLVINSISGKVLRIMHHWIEHHWQDFGFSSEMRKTLELFLTNLVNQAEGEFTEVCRGLMYVADIQRRWFEDLLSTYSRDERRGRGLNSIFEELEAEELAQQLCLYNSEIFRNIHPIEFLNEIWRGADSESSPSFKFFVERFDKESYWVATELLLCRDFKKRVNALRKFITLAKVSLDLNNFFSTFSLISGLNLIPVQRLKKTWEALPEKSKQMWTEVEKISDPSKNMKNYRDRLAIAQPPMVPYLKDLTFINDGNPKTIKNMINVDKLRMMANRVLEITNLGSVAYPYDKKSAVLNYLGKPKIEKDMNKLKDLAAECEKN